MSKIKNRINGYSLIPWEKLKTYEFNELKDKQRDVAKLKNSIINDGFRFPMFLWSGHRFVIDGAGRDKALLELESEGHEICDIPVVEIEAKTKREAKMLALQASSKYGEITEESFNVFTQDMELDDVDFERFELDLNFEVDDVDDDKDDFSEEVDFLKLSFTLHKDQKQIVEDAITRARTSPIVDTGINDNQNSNAITLICEEWLKSVKK